MTFLRSEKLIHHLISQEIILSYHARGPDPVLAIVVILLVGKVLIELEVTDTITDVLDIRIDVIVYVES